MDCEERRFQSLDVAVAEAGLLEGADAVLRAEELLLRASWSWAALDERLDSWHRRAKIRAGYFDQTEWLRAEQRAWLAGRNACGANVGCLKRAYYRRIRTLKNYVEHV